MTSVAAGVGEQIEQARARQRLTQADLAALVGVSRTYISELEGGKETTHLRRLVAVLDALGLELVVQPRTRRLGQQDGLEHG